jgi:hypothetical protein
MMQSLRVYGFGSFFAGGDRPNDLDLLLLHQSTDAASCQFAIDCKTKIMLTLPTADVVMLSEREAEGHQFLVRSKAVALGELHAGTVDAQVQALADRIRAAAFGKF